MRLIDIWAIAQERLKSKDSALSQIRAKENCSNQFLQESDTMLSAQSLQVGVASKAIYNIESNKQNMDCLANARNDSDWQLVVVGSGDMKEEIESKIKEKNLQDSILLKPFTKEIDSEYLSASIYAMSSHFEGFPMVLVEASSLGLPCIAFDVATGPSDIIDSSNSGYLVKDNDLETYAEKLLELMSDESKRKAMGECAKQRVSTHFSKEAILPLWQDIL